MGDFNRGGFGRRPSSGGFGGGSRGGFGGGRDRGGDREMFDAVCDECGDDCKLPFRPSNDKPVFCSTCFEKNSESNGGNSRRDEGRRPSGDFKRNDAPKENLGEKIELLSVKLDKIIDLLGGSKKEKVEKIEKIEDMPVIKKALKTKEEKVEAKEEKPAKKVAAKKVATKKATKK